MLDICRYALLHFILAQYICLTLTLRARALARVNALSHPNSPRRRRHFGKQRHTCYGLLEVWSVAKYELLALARITTSTFTIWYSDNRETTFEKSEH